jgi:uncharacterized protein YbjT (DUF2867 family)
VTDSRTPPSWGHRVSWERGNIFRPATYVSLLRGADAVVHTMGILLEADYKGVVRGQESPISGLMRAFSSSTPRPGNPLERGVEGGGRDADIRPPETKGQLTYENMNRDSAIMLAKEYAAALAPAEAEEAGSSAASDNNKTTTAASFVYVSAAGGAPVLPARYITTKRDAEAVIAREFAGVLRPIFPRPPFMYDASRPVTMPLAALTGAGALFNKYTGGVLGGFMGAAGAKPLKVDVVAEAIVEAIEDEKVRGPIEVQEMEELAHRAWRKSML